MSKSYTVTEKKAGGIVIERQSNMEAYRSIRKPTCRPGAAMRDKRNDYRRKPKHKNSVDWR